MIEQYLSQTLASHLRNFIQDFDDEDVQISLWQGRIVMNDLRLKPSALDYLMKQVGDHEKDETLAQLDSFAFKIEYGRIGKIELNIPWKVLRSSIYTSTLGSSTDIRVSAPVQDDDLSELHDRCSILLSDVNILVIPVKSSEDRDLNPTGLSEIDSALLETRRRVEKERLVQKLIEKLLLNKMFDSVHSQTTTDSDSKSSWFRSFIESIVYTTSVRIRNVDIRYEDPGNCFGFVYCHHAQGRQEDGMKTERGPFAFGLTLKNLTIHSTEETKSNAELFQLPTFENSMLGNNPFPSETGFSSTDTLELVQHKHISVNDFALYYDDRIMVDVKRSKLEAIDPTHYSSKIKNEAEAVYEYYFQATDSFGFFKRAFILEPLSLSAWLTLSRTKRTHKNTVYDQDTSIERDPPIKAPMHAKLLVRLVLLIPSFRVNISSAVLTDALYLYQSLSFYQTIRRNGYARHAYISLLTKRPKDGPLMDPSGWWKYAFKMVVVISSRSRESKWMSWRGIINYVRLRRRYMDLYRALLTRSLSFAEKEVACNLLLRMEDDLNPQQVATLRMSVIQLLVDESAVDYLNDGRQQEVTSNRNHYSVTLNRLAAQIDVLSCDYRERYLSDLISILRLHLPPDSKLMDETNISNYNHASPSSDNLRVETDITVLFQYLSIDFRDRLMATVQEQAKPILQLSSALVVTSKLHCNGSKELGLTLASTELNHFGIRNNNTPHSTELTSIFCRSTRKWMKQSSGLPAETSVNNTPVRLHNRIYHHTASVYVRLSEAAATGNEMQLLFIRLSPIDLLCSVGTIEVLTDVLGFVPTQHYRHFDSLQSIIFLRQTLRRPRTLDVRRQQKGIFMDVELCSPVFLLPDELSYGTLVVDFGRITLTNARVVPEQSCAGLMLDESRCWHVVMEGSQVLCISHPKSAIHTEMMHAVDINYSYERPNYMVEPFSVRLQSMKVISGENVDCARENQFWIQMNLSQLHFNLRTSSVRLLSRLNRNMSMVKRSRPISTATRSNVAYEDSIMNFELNISTISAYFSNDVDGPAWSFPSHRTNKMNIKGQDLVQLTISSVHVLTEYSCISNKKNILMDVTIQHINARDLYQDGGDEFVELLSTSQRDLASREQQVPKKSKVLNIKFSVDSEEYQGKNVSMNQDRKLLISLPDLFIEWNPETIASVQKSMRLSQSEKLHYAGTNIGMEKNFISQSIDSEDSFYEAFENLDKLDESDDFLFTDAIASYGSFDSHEFLCRHRERSAVDAFQIIRSTKKSSSSMDILFSSVFINFNKDNRRRRLAIAHISEVRIHHFSKPNGGFKTTVDMINFTLSDPLHIYGSTLYSEILGLKQESRNTSSVFHLEFESFPRLSDQIKSDIMTQPCAQLNGDTLKIDGCDTLLSLRFSPMRFVYLQQLWMEIIDYFFEGVIGYEVFGKDRPKPFAEANVTSPELIPDDMRFLRFDIEVEAPSIIIPANYRSPNFFSLCCDNIRVLNHFDGKVDQTHSSSTTTSHLQLYNNCSVRFSGLSLKSWCGGQLTFNYIGSFTSTHMSSGRSGMVIEVRWPVGAHAIKIVPKWDVRLILQPIRICLRPSDYSLFQNIIQHNIGEQSRYLSEWVALMSLESTICRKHLDHVLVNFSYDKKDAPSTTYSFTIISDSIEVILSNRDSCKIMVLDCSYLQWNLSKSLDRFVKQTLSIRRISITKDDANREDQGFQNVLQPSTENPVDPNSGPQLSYSSHTRPDGNNVRCLKIRETCLFLGFPTWLYARQFFLDLPSIEVLSPDDVLNSMQLGDRWYKIERSHNPKSVTCSNFPTQLQSEVVENRNLEYQFRISLELTSFIFVSEFTSISDCDSAEGLDPFGAIVVQCRRFDYLSVSSLMATNSAKTCLIDGIDVSLVPAPPYTSRTNHQIMEPSKLGIQWATKNCPERIESRMLLFSEALIVQLSHSDMISALRLYHRIRNDIHRVNSGTASVNNGSNTLVNDTQPRFQYIDVDCQQLSLTLIDDSMRHFSSSQRLIELRCADIRYNSSNTFTSSLSANSTKKFRTVKLEVVDHLQSILSPFHVILTTTKTRQMRDIDWYNSTLATFRHSALYEDEDRVSWESYSIIASHDWGYSCSQDIIDRCRHARADNPDVQYVIEVCLDRQESGNIFSCSIENLVVQWNPSLVVATQSFLGRIRKKVETMMTKMKGPSLDSVDAPDDRRFENHTAKSLSFDVCCGSVTICLNKEHQSRRLLELTIERPTVEVLSSPGGQLSIAGSIDDFMAWDTNDYSRDELQICPKNKLLMSVRRHDSFTQRREKFVTFDYLTNFCPNSSSCQLGSRQCAIPIWTRPYLNSEGDKIDDFLSIQVASLKINFLRDRTAEIVDYLSNGLPGKGMGATSRAATGFIKKRIKTRSFLDLSIDSPEVTIPINRGSEDGIVLYLGDFRLKSWFDEADEDESSTLAEEQLGKLNGHHQNHSSRRDLDDRTAIQDLWRVLSLSVTRLGWHTESHREDIVAIPFDPRSSIDMHVVVRTPLWNSQCMFVRGSSSSIECVLKYNEYALVRDIIQRNILAPVDMDGWDNIEKAYEENLISSYSADSSRLQDGQISDVTVQYVEHAKVVRYGNVAKARSSEHEDQQAFKSDQEGNILNFGFRIFGMKLFLHRDDAIESYGSSLNSTRDYVNYDILLFHVSSIDLSAKITVPGERVLSISFQKLGLFDLGDDGRRLREHIHHPLAKQRKPSAFHVLAEGYDPSSAKNDVTMSRSNQPTNEEASAIPQLHFTLNLRAFPERAAIAQIFVNNLNINPLDRSIQEAAEFFSCAWSKNHGDRIGLIGHTTTPRSSVKPEQTAPLFSWFELSITAHYPTIFFLADETDPLTRALVLRGRAVIKMKFENECLGSSCVQKRKTVKVHLQSMESYINPHAAAALEDSSSMQEILSSDFLEAGSSLPTALRMTQRKESHSSTLGVALIEPVTALLEFAQVERELFPTSRNVSLFIDPVSVSLSFEDVCLIDRIRRRWTYDQQLAKEAGEISKQSSSHSFYQLNHEESRDGKTAQHHLSSPTDEFYEVDFFTTKLGIILRKQGEKVLIDRIQESDQREKVLTEGDEVILINKEAVSGMPFQSILDLLVTSSRPLKVMFRRNVIDYPKPIIVQKRTDESSPMQMLAGETLSNDSMNVNSLRSYDVSRFNVIFKMGCRTGLRFVRSVCGNMAVVDECNVEECKRGMIGGSRIPRAGAVVTGLNGSLGIACEEIIDSIRHYEEQSILANDSTKASCFSITFLEAPSASWGAIDDLSIEILRLKVSLIDDINGRDMPLLRTTLESLSLSLQRGFALETSYIRSRSPFYFLVEGDVTSPNASDFLNDFVIKGRLETVLGMDYYNARISIWEPLLEDSPIIRCLFERQKGSQNKMLPGNTAFVLSDSSKGDQEPYICLNLTDAAIDILTAATHDLKRWMVDNNDPSDLDLVHGFERLNAPSKDESKITEAENSPSNVFDAQKVAADAALIFAKRHGTKPDANESTKPFILRNRTGLGLRFFLRTNDYSDDKERMSKELKYPHLDGKEVLDGEEARFSMDLTADFDFSSSSSKIVRGAEHFPFLNVNLICPKPSFTIETLRDLPVMKIGSTTRRLIIHRSESFDNTDELSSYVVLTVSIESNRRVITISSAVSIYSSIGMPIELGVRNDTMEVEVLGVTSFDKPYFIPLGLDLDFKRAEILMRPKTSLSTPMFEWSSESIIEYNVTRCVWKWIIPSGRNKISCQRPIGAPAYISLQALSDYHEQPEKDMTKRAKVKNRDIGVVLDSFLKLRNALPLDVEWEVSHHLSDTKSKTKQSELSTIHIETTNHGLRPGESVDLIACDINAVDSLLIRFRCSTSETWSSWVSVSVRMDVGASDKGFGKLDTPMFDEARDTIVIRAENEAGVEWTIGLKRSLRPPHGMDLILFSELWIGNFTDLPLVFGAPKVQLLPSSTEVNAGPSAAESALLEISSILEFGERGKGLEKEHDENLIGSDAYELGHQISDEIIEEVFEYIEVAHSLVKRRWWAGEQFDDIRRSPSKMILPDSSHNWRCGGEWMIDCSGGCSLVQGGWESCSNLVGGPSKYFSAKRTFDAYDPFRRRRWFRRKIRSGKAIFARVDGVPILFHQPCNDLKVRKATKEIDHSIVRGRDDKSLFEEAHNNRKICLKILDGKWSSSIEISHDTATDGVIRVPGSRWPQLNAKSPRRSEVNPVGSPASVPTGQPVSVYNYAVLDPRCYELSYRISTLDGPWGDLTKMLTVYPRFSIKNGSNVHGFDIKQSGAPDSTAISIGVAEIKPFFWTDVNLPELICVRPTGNSLSSHDLDRRYKWSGAFDIRKIGMIPLRVREESRPITVHGNGTELNASIKVVRASIEIRPGTGGTGLMISLNEEKNNGEGALYRIENFSPFPLWIVQDGVLANPLSDSSSDDFSLIADDLFTSARDRRKSDSILNGDLVLPSETICFGLDIPYRQGKYSWRDAATIDELTRVRIGLAPLSSRDGIETTKVIELSALGELIRLSPSKLRMSLDEDHLTKLLEVKVLGLVYADGPTKVLKFCLIRKEISVRRVLENSLRGRGPATSSRHPDDVMNRLKIAASHAISLLRDDEIPTQEIASTQMLQMLSVPQAGIVGGSNLATVVDTFSIEVSLNGFLLSTVDSVPSEIAVFSAKSLHFAAKWTNDQRTDATAIITVGCIQVDNFCPNSPFPVSLYPQEREKEDDSDEISSIDESSPFLSLGCVIAPSHDSGMKCFKCVTIESKDVTLAVDLAFIIRFQRFLSGLLEHVNRHIRQLPRSNDLAESRETWVGPNLSRIISGHIISPDRIASSQYMYFQALSVMPFIVKLSVAPANALTYAQALMEGEEAAAIHAAVRKGDVEIGGESSGGIGVKIGGKNRTPLAVIHGVFKSILVDGLLRCDGASLNFPGILIENHMSTSTELKMHFIAHYLNALKSNLPALIGSLSAFGNPVGLIRGLGDGVTAFVREPVKGLKKSVKEMDPSYVMDGVARGTESLARHTFGGIVDSASLITETFSKNMAVLTLDRKYAQRRDHLKANPGASSSFVSGVESGVEKLIHGVVEGVTGVVRAPIRGAEKKGVEGFAKGVGKGLLGLVVKPVIGLSDAATDVMIGVKGTLESTNKSATKSTRNPIRPRRALYTKDRILRSYNAADATAVALMMRTRLAGEYFLSHYDMGDRVALFSVQKLLILGTDGKEQQLMKFKNIKSVDCRPFSQPDSEDVEWGVFIFLSDLKPDGTDFEVIRCETREMAVDMTSQINLGTQLYNRG